MDLFDDLFDGAKSKQKVAPRKLALDESLEDDPFDEQPTLTTTTTTKKNNSNNSGSDNARKRARDEGEQPGPSSKKARASTVLSLDDDDSDALELIPTDKGKGNSKNKEEEELNALLRDAEKLIGPTAAVQTLPSSSQLHALASIQRTGERAAGLRAKLRETSAQVNFSDSLATRSASKQMAAVDTDRNLRITLVDEASKRSMIVPVVPSWTGAELRPLAARSLGLNEAHIVISYIGIPLDSRTLRELNLADGDVLHVRVAAPVAPAKEDDDLAVARRVQALTQQSVPQDEAMEDGITPYTNSGLSSGEKFMIEGYG